MTAYGQSFGAAYGQSSRGPSFQAGGVSSGVEALGGAIRARRKRAVDTNRERDALELDRQALLREGRLLDQSPMRRRAIERGELDPMSADAVELSGNFDASRAALADIVAQHDEQRSSLRAAGRPEEADALGAHPLADVIRQMGDVEGQAASREMGMRTSREARLADMFGDEAPANIDEIRAQRARIQQAAAQTAAERGMLAKRGEASVEWRPKLQAEYMKYGGAVADAAAGLSMVPKFEEIAGRVLKDGATGADDLALIFASMKVLDPGVAVQEGDVVNVTKTGGPIERLVGLFRQLATGGGSLSPAVRQNLVSMVQSQIDATEKHVRALDDSFQRNVLSQHNERIGTDISIDEVRPRVTVDPYGEIAGIVRADVDKARARTSQRKPTVGRQAVQRPEAPIVPNGRMTPEDVEAELEARRRARQGGR